LAWPVVVKHMVHEDDPMLPSSDDAGAVTDTFDNIKSCENKCIFCFIDQNPPGMRETIYVKDDDDVLSRDTGSYITLTNLTQDDVTRICASGTPCLYVSVHTTDPELRCTMMGNNRAGEVLGYLKTFADTGIEFHGQIVVVPDYNDSEKLTKTLKDLQKYDFASIGVVPVGLTARRDCLPKLRAVDCENARDIIERCNYYENVYCADELYLIAGMPLPEITDQQTFDMQRENGIGMMVNMRDDFMSYCHRKRVKVRKAEPFTLITGKACEGFFKDLIKNLPQGKVIGVENKFYGESITVAGLITGVDIIEQLRGGEYYRLLIPSNMLRHEQDVFLDNITPDEIEDVLDCPVQIVPNNGAALVEAICDKKKFKLRRV